MQSRTAGQSRTSSRSMTCGPCGAGSASGPNAVPTTASGGESARCASRCDPIMPVAPVTSTCAIVLSCSALPAPFYSMHPPRNTTA